MSSATTLVLGVQGGQKVYVMDKTYLDEANTYQFSALTNRYAPSGVGAECLFTTLYVTLTYSMAAQVKVTPIVDGVTLTSIARTITTVAPSSGRTTEVYELGLNVPFYDPVDGITETGRVYARGTWVQVRVETLAGSLGSTGDLIIENLEVEYEVRDETYTALP